MEKVIGKTLTEEIQGEAWKEFKTKLESFWNSKFVHVDLRCDNIIYEKIDSLNADKYYLVDFDWAGKVNECRYPLSINMNSMQMLCLMEL